MAKVVYPETGYLRPPTSRRCTGKIKHTTIEAARSAAQEHKRRTGQKTNNRAYFCPECSAFHHGRKRDFSKEL